MFGGRVVGPAAPPPQSESDRIADREDRKERERKERKAERKRDEKEDKQERAGGREGRIEKRRETNASNREMRNKSPGGLEVDEATLMGTAGGQDSFQARSAQSSPHLLSQLVHSLTDASELSLYSTGLPLETDRLPSSRTDEPSRRMRDGPPSAPPQAQCRNETRSVPGVSLRHMLSKSNPVFVLDLVQATMDMFQQMAAQKFGGGGA